MRHVICVTLPMRNSINRLAAGVALRRNGGQSKSKFRSTRWLRCVRPCHLNSPLLIQLWTSKRSADNRLLAAIDKPWHKFRVRRLEFPINRYDKPSDSGEQPEKDTSRKNALWDKEILGNFESTLWREKPPAVIARSIYFDRFVEFHVGISLNPFILMLL